MRLQKLIVPAIMSSIEGSIRQVNLNEAFNFEPSFEIGKRFTDTESVMYRPMGVMTPWGLARVCLSTLSLSELAGKQEYITPAGPVKYEVLIDEMSGLVTLQTPVMLRVELPEVKQKSANKIKVQLDFMDKKYTGVPFIDNGDPDLSGVYFDSWWRGRKTHEAEMLFPDDGEILKGVSLTFRSK